MSESMKNLLENLEREQKYLDRLIMSTPTSLKRELLTGANILILTALNDLKSAQRI